MLSIAKSMEESTTIYFWKFKSQWLSIDEWKEDIQPTWFYTCKTQLLLYSNVLYSALLFSTLLFSSLYITQFLLCSPEPSRDVGFSCLPTARSCDLTLVILHCTPSLLPAPSHILRCLRHVRCSSACRSLQHMPPEPPASFWLVLRRSSPPALELRTDTCFSLWHFLYMFLTCWDSAHEKRQ